MQKWCQPPVNEMPGILLSGIAEKSRKEPGLAHQVRSPRLPPAMAGVTLLAPLCNSTVCEKREIKENHCFNRRLPAVYIKQLPIVSACACDAAVYIKKLV